MATSPCRFATSLSFARRGTFWRKPKQGEVAQSSKHFFCHSEHFLLSFQVLFFVIPNASEESTAWMLRCAVRSVQHDKSSFNKQNRRPDQARRLLYHLSLHQHHLSCLHKLTRLQAVKIHST